MKLEYCSGVLTAQWPGKEKNQEKSVAVLVRKTTADIVSWYHYISKSSYFVWFFSV